MLVSTPATAMARPGPERQFAPALLTAAEDRSLTAAQEDVAEFFKGSGAALHTFNLRTGRYDIQIYAQ
jgi:hypothetical protein